MRYLPTCLAMSACMIAGIAHDAGAEPAGPAFDCKKASYEIELLICKDPNLAVLDRKLASKFANAQKNLSKEQIAELTAEQRGWIKGRNDCWKSNDKPSCTSGLYVRRIVILEARYGLVGAGKSVYFACDDGNPYDLIFTPFETDPPSANLVREETVATVILEPAASGSKYAGDNGISFWEKGGEAMVEWPQGKKFGCKAGPSGGNE